MNLRSALMILAASSLLAVLPASIACAPRATTSPPALAEAPRPLGFPLDDPELEGPHAIYFVMVDRFFDAKANAAPVDKHDPGNFYGGDLAGVTAKLDTIAALGVDTIWISPLALQVPVQFPSVDDDGKPFVHAGFHGYWAEDLAALEPRFGTPEDLETLLDQAHARGIRVLLDVVVNHLGYGATAAKDVARMRSVETKTCEETADPLTQCLFGLPDFRTEDPLVATAVARDAATWFERYPFDGIRFDTLKHAEPSLFADVTRRVREIHQRKSKHSRPLVIGEWWGAAPGDDTLATVNAQGDAVDTLLDFEFSALAVDFCAGRLRAEALAHHLQRRHEAPGPAMAHFLSSHDMPPLTHLLRDTPERMGLALVLQMTTRGIPVIPWGEEIGRSGGPWPHNRRPMQWERLDVVQTSLRDAWTSLLHTRARLPALRGRGWTTLAAKTTPAAACLVFAKTAPGSVVVVGIARGEPCEVEIDREKLPPAAARTNGATRVDGVGIPGNFAMGNTFVTTRIHRDSADIWELTPVLENGTAD